MLDDGPPVTQVTAETGTRPFADLSGTLPAATLPTGTAAGQTLPPVHAAPAGPVREGATAEPGELVGGRFRIQELLGRGSAADVFAAVDEQTGDPVALKVVRYATAATLDALRFELERALLAGLRHENLVGFVDSGADRSHVWLAMHRAPGGTLAVVPRPIALHTVVLIGLQVARALAYVHDRGVIHRDVKPANILVDDDVRRVYLADFGIARENGDPDLTQTGLVLGTAAYLAPEQVRGQPATTACDVFSLGLVMLECLTGRREYPGGLVESAVARLHRRPDVSVIADRELRDLLRQMTAPDPKDRPTAVAVADRLAGMLH